MGPAENRSAATAKVYTKHPAKERDFWQGPRRGTSSTPPFHSAAVFGSLLRLAQMRKKA